MKRIAIIYGHTDNTIQKKALEVLNELLLDYTQEYPTFFQPADNIEYEKYTCIYIGTRETNAYIKEHSSTALSHSEEYCIKVEHGIVVIEGYDDAGVLYGCIDFYNKYLKKLEYPSGSHLHYAQDSNYKVINPLKETLPDFEYSSYPSIKSRGIWSWGHVIYDYKRFFDNMVKLKLNTFIIWNDFLPVNATDMIAYAHSCAIKIFFGFSWGWDTDCKKFSLDTVNSQSMNIFHTYEEQYSHLGADGIYFQSFTELWENHIGDVLIADAVTNFVNHTSLLFFEKYPELEIQFGLHASSVKDDLEYLKKVDSRIRIVWEDCGAFPFAYSPRYIKNFEETVEFTKNITVLRGTNDKFGVVTKGFTTLDWFAFDHSDGPVHIGNSSRSFKTNRIEKKHKAWKFVQAYWLTNADKAYEMIKTMYSAKQGDLVVTALVEDGMFEENIMYPVALYSEMLWDCNHDLSEMINEVALRSYVDFA